MARLSDSMLKSIMPFAPIRTRKAALPVLEHTALSYDIVTAPRLRMWLATLAAESGELKYQEELASGAAYEGRRDLGNTQAGDGRRFKGRGRIQGTGRAVYASYTKYLKQSGHIPFVDLIANPQRLAEEPYATDFSGWFVNGFKDLNPLADAGNFLAYQVRVNGRNRSTGKPNHWTERQNYYRRAIGAIPSNFILTDEREAIDEVEIDRDALEGTAGYPDFDVIERDSKDIAETPNGENEDSVSSPDTQDVSTLVPTQTNVSNGLETPIGGITGDPKKEPKVDTPQTIVKEKVSWFTKIITAIGTFIATVIASITTTCGGTEVSRIVQEKGAAKVIENADRSDLTTFGFVLLYIALGLGAAVALLFIVSKFHDKAAERAERINQTKLQLAGNRDKNTVEFTNNLSGAPDNVQQ